MNAIISCIQSPCPVIHCKIWKPGLSLGSSVYQRDAQGQCLHSFMPGSKANSLSESYWPTYIHKVLTDYKLGRDIKAFTSLQWNTKTLCVVSSLYSLESANKKPHLSLHFGENRAPQCGFHVSMGKECICIYLWRHNAFSKTRKSHQWSYFITKLAANKGLVSALSCGKQILRGSTGILTEGQCSQEVCGYPTPRKENFKKGIYVLILQNGRIQYSMIWEGKIIPISKEKRHSFIRNWFAA